MVATAGFPFDAGVTEMFVATSAGAVPVLSFALQLAASRIWNVRLSFSRSNPCTVNETGRPWMAVWFETAPRNARSFTVSATTVTGTIRWATAPFPSLALTVRLTVPVKPAAGVTRTTPGWLSVNSVTLLITGFETGVPLPFPIVGVAITLRNVSKPPVRIPNTVCWKFRCCGSCERVWSSAVMKNCESPVSSPEFAIASNPWLVNVRLVAYSSGSFVPLPPVPFPLGSPPCATNPGRIRWKVRLS